MSSNITYSNITQANYENLSLPVNAISLKHLFIMSEKFVNLVFIPFSAIEEFVFDVVRRSNGFGGILAEWQTLLSLEAGFVTCLVFGFAFVILSPIIGLIICYYRICTERCGGTMVQSPERAKSKWRHVLFTLLLSMSGFIAIPCFFVFLTNEWTTQVIISLPETINSTVGGVSVYVDSLTNQLAQIVKQYEKVDSSLRRRVENLGTSLGEPLKETLTSMATPILNKASKLYSELEHTLAALRIMEASSATLVTGIANLTTVLATRRQALNNDLLSPACNRAPSCRNLQNSTGVLTVTGTSFLSGASAQNEINSIENTLTTYNMSKEISDVMQHFNNITQLVADGSKGVGDPILASLTEINDTLASSISKLPLDTVENIKTAIEEASAATITSINDYALNLDVYRYTSGILLGFIITIILVLYWLGIGYGTKNFNDNSIKRSHLSNWGGIFIMAAVGLTFIFSWLLMLLVIALFTTGGHAERYVCQSLEPPYQGLKLLDRLMESGGIYGVRLNNSIYKFVVLCKDNTSIYEALNIDQMYNLTELIENASNRANAFRSNLSSVSANLSLIKIHSPEIKDALSSMKRTGLDNIDLTRYRTQIAAGLTTANLGQYALLLNHSAEIMLKFFGSSITGPELLLVNKIRSHSFAILQIQSTMKEPLSEALDTLENTLPTIQNLSTGFNRRIDDLDAALKGFDADISTNGSRYVLNATHKFMDLLLSDIDGYADWFQQQITQNFGACRPLYIVYATGVSLVCDYFIDILNGLWFSFGWSLFFLIPTAVVGMKLAKFYRILHKDHDKASLDVKLDEINSRVNHLKTFKKYSSSSQRGSSLPDKKIEQSEKYRRDERLDEKLDEINSRYNHLNQFEERLDEKMNAINSLEINLNKDEERLEEKLEEISSRNDHLNNDEEWFDVKLDEINSRENNLNKYEERLDEKLDEINSRENYLNKNEEWLDEKMNEINSRENNLNNNDRIGTPSRKFSKKYSAWRQRGSSLPGKKMEKHEIKKYSSSRQLGSGMPGKNMEQSENEKWLNEKLDEINSRFNHLNKHEEKLDEKLDEINSRFNLLNKEDRNKTASRKFSQTSVQSSSRHRESSFSGQKIEQSENEEWLDEKLDQINSRCNQLNKYEEWLDEKLNEINSQCSHLNKVQESLDEKLVEINSRENYLNKFDRDVGPSRKFSTMPDSSLSSLPLKRSIPDEKMELPENKTSNHSSLSQSLNGFLSVKNMQHPEQEERFIISDSPVVLIENQSSDPSVSNTESLTFFDCKSCTKSHPEK